MSEQKTTLNELLNTVITGDCVEVLPNLPAESIDFVLTDPPYLTSYKPRDGRRVTNDDKDNWLEPTFRELYRVLRPNSFCLTFYGWPHADRFLTAFRAAGFSPVTHFSFIKNYPSFRGYTLAHHEVAYLLAKGRPQKPEAPISDVLNWAYTGNKLHPTQKPVDVLVPLIRSFAPERGVVLDPFCGSGSTLLAARICGRNFIGVELEAQYAEVSSRRLRDYRRENAA